MLGRHLRELVVNGGAEEACHFVRASHLAAVAAAGLQVLDPFPAAGLEACSELVSGGLGAGFLQTLGYLVPWYHCSLAMEVRLPALRVAQQRPAPPSACWPFFSLTFVPAGACAVAAAAAASA